jgi:CRP-like cAMP-binding protein
LLADQDLLKRVLAEVDAVFAIDPLNLTALGRMPVLGRAVKEALRLYPQITVLSRHVRFDFEFEGYRFKRGQEVAIAGPVTHFLDKYFAEPYSFDVERYMPPRSEHHQPWVLAPFGLGNHNCLGAGLTEVLIQTTITGLLRTVTLKAGTRGSNFVVGSKRDANVQEVDLDVLEDEESSLLLSSMSMNRAMQVDILSRANRISFEPGEVIIQQGDEADTFYILAEGNVNIYREEEDRHRQFVTSLSEGAFFGEIGLLEGVKRTATVRVSDDRPAEVLALNRDAFMEIVADSDLTGAEIAAIVRQRTIGLNLAKALPSLTTKQLETIFPQFESISFDENEVIIRQGDPSDRFYILVKGKVDIVDHFPGGEDIIVDQREEGDYLGEIGLLQNKPRTATVRVSEGSHVEALALDRDAFLELVDDSKATEMSMAREMIQRMINLANAQEQVISDDSEA